ncbi:MAG: alpha/beta hydrolase [Anaerolineales bacterium]|nr:alpha/beta hydrolase [Anaerolineales bacterium]
MLSKGWLTPLLIVCLLHPLVKTNGQDELKPTYPDIRYVEDGDYSQKVDIYLPETDNEAALPTILLLHGSGYTKWDMEPLAAYFVAQGYAAIAVEYRSRREVFINDLFCALAWTHAEAETYGFDSTRLIVLGHSMGGYGAAALGIVDDTAPYMEECPHTLPETDRLQAVILFGAGADESIMPQIDGNEPPFLLVHGDKDTRVRPAIAESLVNALADAEDDVTLVILPDVGHYFTNPTSEPGQLAIEAVATFLDNLEEKTPSHEDSND